MGAETDWQAVMPLGGAIRVGAAVRTRFPIQMLPDISFTVCPEWVKRQVNWSNSMTEDTVRGSELALVASYHGTSPQDKALDDRMTRVILALWVSRPAQYQWPLIAYGKLVGAQFERHIWNTRPPLIPHVAYRRAELLDGDFNFAAHITQQVASCTDGPVFVALSNLYMALQQTWWEGRFLLFWVAIEALFAPDSEVSFRISQRIAKFLRPDAPRARSLFRAVRKCYKVRSKVAHGQTLRSLEPGDSKRFLLHSEMILRRSLMKIFSDPAVLTEFQSNRREKFLDSLCI